MSNLISFDFLRRDGAIFFAYLPILFLCCFEIDEELARSLINFYLVLMSTEALVGLVQFFSPDSLVIPVVQNTEVAGKIFYGFYSAHNAAGAAYCIASLLAFSMLLFERERQQIVSRWSLYLGFCLMGLAMTKSRGAYLAFIAAAWIIYLPSTRERKRSGRVVLFAVIPTLCAILLQPGIADRLKTVTNGTQDPNVVERLMFWQRAVNYFEESPLVGIGFGRFNDEDLRFSGVSGVANIATDGHVINNDRHAHNSYLHFAAEGGLIGLGLMLAIWISILRWTFWARKYLPQYCFSAALARAIAAAILMEGYLSLEEHMMNSAVTTLSIFLMFGVLKSVMANQVVPVPVEKLRRTLSTSNIILQWREAK